MGDSQGSNASWKVLVFSGIFQALESPAKSVRSWKILKSESLRSWKVLENEDPG